MKEVQIAQIKAGSRSIDVMTVYNSLEVFQELVGGYIECVVLPHNIVMVVNDEGAINDNEYNLTYNGNHIFGDIFFIGEDGDDFTDLTTEQIYQLFDLLNGK